MKLSDLAPGDVAVFFEDDEHNRFVLTDDRRCQYVDGSSIRVNGATEVRAIGRGRYVPPVPGRIAMDGEPDAGLTWTDAKPTVPGWYWYRNELGGVHITEVRKKMIGDIDDVTGQFAGPIPVPAERGEGK